MYRRVVKVKRVHGAGSGDETEIVIANENLHASGVFSNVYRAQLLLPTQQTVAIKKIWLSKTIVKSAEQEIRLLQRVHHPNVISLLYYFKLNADTETCDCLVFDYLPTDLSKLRQQLPGRRFDPLDAKLYAWQMFAGLDHVNSYGITHCDIKPSNLIVDDRHGLLKLADFGNAKILTPGVKLNPYQVTRYYRAPELVFCTTEFTMAVDKWAAACVLAELITGKPLLAGRDSVDQGRIIVDVLGYPTEEQIKEMRISRPRLLRKTGRGFGPLVSNTNFPDQALDIVVRVLVYSPSLRMSFESALAHPYFDELRSSPAPRRSNGVPIPPLCYWTEQKTQSERSNRLQTVRKPANQITLQSRQVNKVETPAVLNTQSGVFKRWWFW